MEENAEHLKIMPVEQCGYVGQCMTNPASYEREAGGSWGYYKPSKKRVAEVALRKLEEARAKDIETHERNVPALANNKRIYDQAVAFMKGIGIPDSYVAVDPRSRARYPKKEKHIAGYLLDLRRECKIDDGFAHATATYERLKRDYDTYAEEAEREAERERKKAEQEAERRKEERRKNLRLAEIIMRYDLDPDVEIEDVLAKLSERNQRIDLAVAMRQTRDDWSEGPYRVSDALRRFTIETDEDKDIVVDVSRYLGDGWDGDGRIFRDCAWNYDRLFDSVDDKQLVADVQTAYEWWADRYC